MLQVVKHVLVRLSVRNCLDIIMYMYMLANFCQERFKCEGDSCLQLATAEAIGWRVITGIMPNPLTTPVLVSQLLVGVGARSLIEWQPVMASPHWMVEDSSVNSVKTVLLDNLVPCGIQSLCSNSWRCCMLIEVILLHCSVFPFPFQTTD